MMLLFWVICIHLHVPLSFIFYFLHKGANTTSRARRLIALIKEVGAKESKTNLVFFHTEAPLWKHSELRWRWLKFKWSLICTTRYSIALMQTFSFKRSWYGSQVKQKQLSQLIFYRIGISCSIHCLSWLHLIPPHIGKKKMRSRSNKWRHKTVLIYITMAISYSCSSVSFESTRGCVSRQMCTKKLLICWACLFRCNHCDHDNDVRQGRVLRKHRYVTIL